MPVLTVAYGRPDDPAAFDRHYAETHVGLAEKIPDLQQFTWKHCASLDDDPPPHYLLAQLWFASDEVMRSALQSDEAAAAVADVQNFATGGATMFVQTDS